MRIVAKLALADILKERGIRQKELAEMASIRPSAISRLVRGYVDRVEIDHLSRIATALNITDMNELIKLEVTA